MVAATSRATSSSESTACGGLSTGTEDALERNSSSRKISTRAWHRPPAAEDWTGSVRRLDAQQMNPHAVLLDPQHTHSEVFITCEQDARRHGSVAGQGDHVRHNKGIYTFLLTVSIYETKSDLDIRQLGQRNVLRCRSRCRAVIPVNPE